MRNFKKFLIGSLMVCCTLFSLLGLTACSGKYATIEHKIEEKVTSVFMDASSHITILPAEGETKVVCYERPEFEHSVTVEDEILKICKLDKRKWYQGGGGGNWGMPEVTIYLPKGEYDMLDIDGKCGDVTIAKDFQFVSIDIARVSGTIQNSSSAIEEMKISGGSIKVENASAGSIELSASIGGITITNMECKGNINGDLQSASHGYLHFSSVICENLSVKGGKQMEFLDITCKNIVLEGSEHISLTDVTVVENFSAITTRGSVSLENVIVNGNLSIKSDSGSIYLGYCDAAEISVETKRGDIGGILLSDKIFVAYSNSGKVKVPETTTGGKCRLITRTGDIRITID